MRRHAMLFLPLAAALAVGPAWADDARAPSPSPRGWVGIKVGLVPEAVSVQLGLHGRGVMVRNVVEGSPADKAGLERHDVVVAVEGQDVTDDLDKFVDVVLRHGPGEEISLTIIRAGHKKTVSLRLGSAGEKGQTEHIHPAEAKAPAKPGAGVKVEVAPGTFWRELVKPHGGLLEKGAQGWIIVTPGGKIELGGDLLKGQPKPSTSSKVEVRVEAAGPQKAFKIVRSTNGRTVELESTPKGGILVRKSEETDDGKKTVCKEYSSAEELRADDREAYELYEQVNAPFVPKPPQAAEIPRKPKTPIVPKTPETPAAPKTEKTPIVPKTPGILKTPKAPEPASAPAARKPLKTATSKTFTFRAAPLREAGEAGKLSMDQLEQRLREMVAKGPSDTTTARIEIVPSPAAQAAGPQFTIEADGRITARVTEGGSTAVFVFKNAEEMKKTNPKLHEQLRKVIEDGGK